MPLLISGIRTGLCETEQDVIDHAIHLLGSEQGMVRSASLNKRSLDARRKDHITWVSVSGWNLKKMRSSWPPGWRTGLVPIPGEILERRAAVFL